MVGEIARVIRSRMTGGGALRSGLTATTDLNVANAACDALLAVALASTLFFAVPTGQARGRVALYLLVTIAPFAVLAPVIGPLLDRVGKFRRVSMAVTLLVRGVLAWVMAHHTGGIALYPLALGALIGSKAYGVAKSAVVPRVVPPEASLVAVNSRLQLASTIGSVLAAPIGLAIAHQFHSSGLLHVAAISYIATALLLLPMPAHVDAPRAAEERATVLPIALSSQKLLGNLPFAMRRVLPIRALVGFLTLFLAFYLRQHGHQTQALAVLAGAVAGGNVLGLLLGRASRRHKPEGIIVIAQVVAALACVAAAVFFSLTTALLLAGLAQLAAVMSKLCLDAVMQRDVPESRRSSAFGVSETAYQLVWVAGGAIGLIPFTGRQGFILAAVLMGLTFLLSLPGERRLATPDEPTPADPVLAANP
jgi:MFS family permease